MSARFCSQCGARLIVGPVHGREREHCPTCSFVVFYNPAPVGLAVVEHQGRLALVRRTQPPLSGWWAPPAGHVEIGESVPEATVREVREETGLEVELGELIGVYSQADVKVVIIAYRARALGGEPRAGDDADAIALFAPGEAPDQPPPADATPYDRWFHGVLQSTLAGWQKSGAQA